MVRIVTDFAHNQVSQNEGLRTLAEEREEQIRRNQEATQSAEASLTFPPERSPIIAKPNTEGLGDLDFTPEYDESDSDIGKIADDINRRKQENPQYSPISDVESQTIPQPTLSHGPSTPDQGLIPTTASQQTGIIAGARRAEEFPSLDLLAATVPDGVETYSDFNGAVGYGLDGVADAIETGVVDGLDPILEQGFNKTRKTFGGLEMMSNALTYATFHTLLDKQTVHEDRLIDLDARRAGLEYEGKDSDTYEANLARYNKDVESVEDIGLNTQHDANTIFNTASRIMAAQQGLPPNLQEGLFDHITEDEKGALADVVFQSLEGNNVLTRSPEDKTWNVTDTFEEVKASVPDLVRALNKASQKNTSDIPSTGGRSATGKGAQLYPTGKSQGRHEATWNQMTTVALDFLNSQPFQVYNTPVDLTLSFLQNVLYYGTALSGNTQTQFAVIGRNGSGSFPNINPNLVDTQPLISEHPIAGNFKMSLSDFRKSFNKARLNKAKTTETAPAQISDAVQTTLFNIVKTDEEMSAIIQRLNGSYYGTIAIHEQKLLQTRFRDSVDRFNNAASNYNKVPFEALLIRDKVQYSHHGQIGQSGRIQVLDTNINVQGIPGDRGIYISPDSFVVDPNENGEVEKNSKAMIARTFNLGKHIPNNRDTSRSGTVKAEHAPRRSDRESIFDNHFGKDGVSKTDGEVYSNAAEILTRFGDPAWSAENILSNDTARRLAQSYAKVKETKDGKHTHWVIDAFADSQVSPQSGEIVGPNLTDEQWNQVAIALGVKKKSKKGELVAGDAKEASLHLNALLALARWNKGIPFNGASLVTELDGTNNSFAILSILTGDQGIAETAGLINPDVAETGRILTDGDMRVYVNEQAFKYIDSLQAKDEPRSNEAISADEAMRKVLTAIETSGGQKAAWKNIVMQAGYGKAFESFQDQWIDALTSDDSIIIEDEVVVESAGRVAGILQYALDPLLSYIKLTQNTGTWASILDGELGYVSSIGVPINLAGRQSDVFQKGTIALDNRLELDQPRTTQIASKQLGVTDAQRIKDLPTVRGEPISPKYGPFTKDEGGYSQSPAQIDAITNAAIAHANAKGKGEDAQQRFREYAKLTWIQRNRSPVNPIHAEDASVMIATINEAARLKTRPWFTETFDAVTVNPKSYSIIPDMYNRNLQKVVSGIDRYGQDIQELQRIKRDAINAGNPLSAMILLTLTDIPSAESKTMIKEIQRRQKDLTKAIYELERSPSGGDPAITRRKDYDLFTQKRTKKAHDELLKEIRDKHKLSPAFMQRLFKSLFVYDIHIADLKKQRKLMITMRKELLKKAKRVSTNEEELPLFLNMT